MNTLFLIGNGFDLAHGLKTKYSDFILWYLNQCLNKAFATNYIHDDTLLRLKILTFTTHDSYASLSELENNLRRGKLELTYKHPFIESIISRFIDLKWVDIEAEYYAQIIKIYKHIEKVKYEYTINPAETIQPLNNCFSFIKDKLIEFLTIESNQTCTINEEIHQNIKSAIALRTNSSTRNLFLNFNYTSTINLYTKEKSSFTINIHGSLNDTDNPIIFGYGDEMDTNYSKIEDLNSNPFLDYIKSFNYFKTNNYQQFSKFLEDGQFSVLIMGHSCGISDRILLNSIFEHPNCEKIKIYYYQKDEAENDYFEKTQEISRHFHPKHKDIMRNKIVSFPESSPLIEYKG